MAATSEGFGSGYGRKIVIYNAAFSRYAVRTAAAVVLGGSGTRGGWYMVWRNIATYGGPVCSGVRPPLFG